MLIEILNQVPKTSNVSHHVRSESTIHRPRDIGGKGMIVDQGVVVLSYPLIRFTGSLLGLLV
jgi:hypothetical protein